MRRPLDRLNRNAAACPDFMSYLDIRRAIVKREFFVEYQPKVSLVSGAIEGLEALVRWGHRRLGRLSPDVFIPRLERTDLIHSLTTSVLEEAAATCAALHRSGSPVGIAVNVAPAAVTESLPKYVDAALHRTRLDHTWLTLEITQSMPFDNLSKAHSILNAVRGRGVHISLDDFGMGYGSLAQLVTLPFDEIKIDRLFAGRSGRSIEAAEIARFTTILGHSLGMRVVAEGVEDRRTLSTLHAMGVDVLQGHYLSKAVGTADLLAEFPLIADRIAGRLGKRSIDLAKEHSLLEAPPGDEHRAWA